MSLGSHGDDREIYRTQHLFCYGTEKQLAYFAPAPSPEKKTMRVKLPCGSDDLLCGRAFADNGVAGDLLPACFNSPRFHGLDREVDSARRIVIGHAGSIGGNSCSRTKDVQQDNARVCLMCLHKGK